MAVTQFGKPLELMDMADPVPSQGEIILSVSACAICGSDLKFMSGYYEKPGHTATLPGVPGHEIVGVVDAIGPGVQGWQIGDRGVVYVYVACGECLHCRSGDDRLCSSPQYHIGLGNNGGFAEKIKIPAYNLVKISDKLSDEDAVVITDAVTTSLHAVVDIAQVKAGDRVVIIGAGGIGIHVLQFVLLSGGYAIMLDINDTKLSQSKDLGAHETYCIERFRDLPSDISFNKIIDASGSLDDWEAIYEKIEAGGTVVMVGYADKQMLNIPSLDLIIKEITVKGSRGGSLANIYTAIDMVERGLIKPIISTVAKLADANSVIDNMKKNNANSGRNILIP